MAKNKHAGWRAKENGRPSSGRRMIHQYGKAPMLLGLLPDQRAKIEAAAKAQEIPMTQFVIAAAVAAAEKYLEKTSKK